MDKTAPISSTAQDARFIQAGVNAAFQDRIGEATDVEFNFLGPSAGDSEGSYATDQLVEVRVSSAQQGLAKVQVGVEIYRNNGHVLALLGAQYRHGAHDEGGISNHSVDVCAGRT